MENKKHSEKEIVSFLASNNFLANSLLKELDKIHKKNEQFFGECSVLGVDRLNLLGDYRKLIKDFQEKIKNDVDKYQSQCEPVEVQNR